MASMEIILMPIAVLNDMESVMPLRNIIMVSNAMLVSRPLIIARAMIAAVGQGMPVNWKKAIVPKSPIEHPIRHQRVLYALFRQVCLHRQNVENSEMSATKSVIKLLRVDSI